MHWNQIFANCKLKVHRFLYRSIQSCCSLWNFSHKKSLFYTYIPDKAIDTSWRILARFILRYIYNQIYWNFVGGVKHDSVNDSKWHLRKNQVVCWTLPWQTRSLRKYHFSTVFTREYTALLSIRGTRGERERPLFFTLHLTVSSRTCSGTCVPHVTHVSYSVVVRDAFDLRAKSRLGDKRRSESSLRRGSHLLALFLERSSRTT